MNNGKWPLVPLGQVLTQFKEYIEAPEPRVYPKLSVKLYGRGVTLDMPADGTMLKMKRHQVARAGQVILSEIWGKRGAIGFVPPEGNGALCTSHFFLFDVTSSRLATQWLHYIFAANYLQRQLDTEAKGTTGYAAVRPAHFLRAVIPLPPVNEQCRIVETLDALAERTNMVGRLRNEVDRGLSDLCRSLLRGNDGCPCRPTPMSELVRLRQPDVHVRSDDTYHFAGVYCFGEGVFVGQRKSGMEFKYPRLTRLKAGDFVYPKLMAWEGALAVVPPDCDGLVVSTEYPVFEIDTSKVLPEVLDIYFRTPSIWPELSGQSTGTNVRRRRLNPADFLRYTFPLPPMALQQRLKAVHERATAIRREHEDTSQEAAALFPAILNRAFTGQLVLHK